jgi:hypothetical protein
VIDDVIGDLTGRHVVPDGETVSGDLIPDIVTALSLKKNSSPQEIWDYYESLAQSRVPARSYAETLKIRDQAQQEILKKRRRVSKPTAYVAKKEQGEIKSLNVTEPPRKTPCISYDQRVEVYRILSEMSDEERREYFCHRKN